MGTIWQYLSRVSAGIGMRGLLYASIVSALPASGILAAQPAAQAAAKPAEILARVGPQDITLQEYAMALRTEAKRRFFHAKPPEDVLAAFRREVADQLIDRALAVQEARRRGIHIDGKAIDAEMEKFKARSRAQSGTEHDNKPFWDALRKEMELEQLLGKLKTQVNARITPATPQIKTYYEQHPEKFTQPEQFHVSVILLRVAPSSPQTAWDAATREAEQIRGRMKAGADFAELARVHSSDKSAAQGGDMGYLHKGMLASNVEDLLAQFPKEGITDPVTVLEGVALFKLHEKRAARLGTFDEVKARATDLWLKEQQAQAWKTLIASLRASTTIKVEEKYLLTPS